MIAGIEGLHSWTPPDEEAAVVTLNDLSVWPRYRVTRVSGLHSLADPQDNRDNRVGDVGEITRLSKRRGKTVVYEGRIEARSTRELREADTALRDAFAEIDTEGLMSVDWHEDNHDFADLGPRYFTARALTCEIVDEQRSKRYDRSFVIGLRMSDPRYFETDTGSGTATIVNTNTTYGIEP